MNDFVDRRRDTTSWLALISRHVPCQTPSVLKTIKDVWTARQVNHACMGQFCCYWVQYCSSMTAIRSQRHFLIKLNGSRFFCLDLYLHLILECQLFFVSGCIEVDNSSFWMNGIFYFLNLRASHLSSWRVLTIDWQVRGLCRCLWYARRGLCLCPCLTTPMGFTPSQ